MKRAQTTTAPLIPLGVSLAALSDAAASCKACDLWKNATQTVFGEGSENARMVMVGEQPGIAKTLPGVLLLAPLGLC